jgi:predicted dehydrogenase
MLKAGIVGCGFMGRMHANVFKALGNADLVAFADLKPERAKAYADEFGGNSYGSIAEMVKAEGLDAVHICTPTDTHKDLTLEAFDAGVHVLCEKPMAMSVAEADAMIAGAASSGKRLMIGHCIRFWPEYQVLKELVDTQRFGKLLSVNLTRYGSFPTWQEDDWNEFEERAGGGVLDMHIHDTDYILHLLGEPDTIDSWGVIDKTGPAHAFTTMTFGGAIAQVEGGWNLPSCAPFKMAFRAIFENGAAIMDAGPLTLYEDGKEAVEPEFEKVEVAGGGNLSDLGGYLVEIKHFVDRLISGEEFDTVTPESSKRSLEVTLEEIRQIKAKANG